MKDKFKEDLKKSNDEIHRILQVLKKEYEKQGISFVLTNQYPNYIGVNSDLSYTGKTI